MDPHLDAPRVTVKPHSIEKQEALGYDFDDPKPNSAVIAMRWENVAVPFKVEVATPEIVEASLRNQLRGRIQFEWQPGVEAATFLMDNKLSAEEAAKYAEAAIANEDRFEDEIAKAWALRILGRKEAAQAAYDKALSMGSQPQNPHLRPRPPGTRLRHRHQGNETRPPQRPRRAQGQVSDLIQRLERKVDINK